MCGIVGIVGSTTVTERLVEGLRRLEYRGYDSAGVAVITPEGVLERRRAPGKISGLDQAIASDPADGAVGIGHTRWATHGAPTLENAHPHASGPVAIVHNGIIENYAELREELKAAGFACSTPTDSEVIAHLIAAGLKRGLDMAGAFHAAVDRLRGAYALAALNVEDPDALYVARSGCPLVVGLGETEGYVGSDSLALAGWTNKVIYLEEGDRAIVTAGDVRILDAQQRPANREVHVSRAVAGFADKGEYRHFMEKEIHEQPDAIAHTLSRYVDVDAGRFTWSGVRPGRPGR